MICPVCQTENNEGSQFCAGCGIQMAPGVTTMPAAFGLASRWSRLFAGIVDGVIIVAVLVIGGPISPSLGLIALAAVLIVQAILLTKDGQTLGKKALKIRIVKRDTSQNGGFVPNVLLRVMVNGIPGFIVPFYGLVDILFIFRQDRRFLHDMIAGTQVVDA